MVSKKILLSLEFFVATEVENLDVTQCCRYQPTNCEMSWLVGCCCFLLVVVVCLLFVACSCSSFASSSCLPFIYHQSKATHLCLTIPNNHQSKPAIAISPPIFVQELLRPEREIDCLVDVGSMSDHPQMTNGSTHRSMFVGGGSTFRRFGVFF